jgi:hypothetical protein
MIVRLALFPGGGTNAPLAPGKDDASPGAALFPREQALKKPRFTGGYRRTDGRDWIELAVADRHRHRHADSVEKVRNKGWPNSRNNSL